MKSQIHIEYKLPLNYQTEWAHLFKPDYKYKSVDLKVKSLNNVFVNHYGLVIKNGFLAKGCAPNIGISTYDNSHFFSHWRKSSEQMLVARYGKSVPSIKLDDNKTYLVIHSPWFSYYFWLTECLPRLLMVKEHLKDLTLIYPASWKNISFVNETLDLFPELQQEIIQSDVHMWVKNLVMPEVKPWTPMFIPEQVFEVRDLILGNLEKKKLVLPNFKNIYVSRRDAKRKNFENALDASAFFKGNGFSEISFSDYNIFEQASIVNKAKNITSITGAGMSNLIFLARNANVLDITNIKYLKETKYKFHFWKLVNIVKGNYFVTFLDHVNDPDVPRFSLQNLIFKPEETQEIVNLMLK